MFWYYECHFCQILLVKEIITLCEHLVQYYLYEIHSVKSRGCNAQLGRFQAKHVCHWYPLNKIVTMIYIELTMKLIKDEQSMSNDATGPLNKD